MRAPGTGKLTTTVAAGSPSFATTVDNISDPLVQVGTATNVSSNLIAIEDSGNTIFYSTKTDSSGSYTLNNVMHNVTIDANRVLTSKAVQIEATNSPISYEIVEGSEVATLNDNVWYAKQEGRAVYKTSNNEYVELNVTENAGVYAINETILSSHTYPELVNASLVSAPTGVGLHGNTIYGTAAGQVVIDSQLKGQSVRYLANATYDELQSTTNPYNLTLLEGTLAALTGWIPASVATSNLLRFDKENDKYYILGTGTETITFTSENGVTKDVTFTVADDYALTSTSGNDIIYATYETGMTQGTVNGHTVTVSFAQGLNLAITDLDSGTLGTFAVHNQNELHLSLQADPGLSTFTVNVSITSSEFPSGAPFKADFIYTGDNNWTVTLTPQDATASYEFNLTQH